MQTGKTYYDRLLEMTQEKEAGEPAACTPGKQQRQAAAAKPAARTPGLKAYGKTAAAAPAAAPVAAPAQPAAAKLAPAPLQVQPTAGTSAASAAAKALLTPNTQRRKLNELTQSLQLLKVSSRQAGKAAQRSGTPPVEEAGPAQEVPAPSRTPRARSATPAAPDAEPAVASGQGPAQPAVAVPPKTGGKRSGRRGASPPVETAAAAAPTKDQPAAEAGQQPDELAAAYDMLTAALADKDGLAEQLAAAQAELAAERATQQVELQALQAELAEERERRQVRWGAVEPRCRGRCCGGRQVGVQAALEVDLRILCILTWRTTPPSLHIAFAGRGGCT